MKLIFKNTDLNIELHPSNSNIGLRENDYWYLVSLCVKNEEYNEVLIDVLGSTTIGVEMVASALTVNQEFKYLFDMAAIQELEKLLGF